MEPTPVVSVIVTARPGGAGLAGTLRSVLGQTLRPLEVILVAGDKPQAGMPDARLRLAADAGEALRTARGRWIGFVEAGDVLRRDRLERLVLVAEADGAELIADNPMVIGPRPRLVCKARKPGWIDRPAAAVGLKPLMRRERVRQALDEGPAPGEAEMIRRLMSAGQRLRLLPDAAYLKGVGARPRGEGRRILVLSRQRIAGAASGSSAYLLSVAGALRRAGYSVSFLGVSPSVFGRWPAIRLKPETRVFDGYRIRGGVRIGDWVLALDPRIAAKAALTAVEMALGKLKLVRPGWVKPAPYSVAVAATPADLRFIARHAGEGIAGVLCDYAYLAPLAAYSRAPEAPVQVLMHDLFSSRSQQFARVGAQDSVAQLSAEEEFRLLACADAVIAIQAAEAEAVRRRLPDRRVVLGPMAVEVGAPQPGRGDRLLFVGSNTAPNTIGLQWFLETVWPAIRQARPDAVLKVAGSVSRTLTTAPEGVEVLGVVDRLDELYREAGVVISPLLTGSGLKIKLVEGLAAGKAMVVTSTTLQGVERIARAAVRLADEPQAFAAEVIELLRSEAARRQLCERAVRCAREHFSPQACYAEVVAGFAGEAQTPPESFRRPDAA